MVKVKNISEHPRQFLDERSREIIIVEPGKIVETNSPPKPSSVWEMNTELKKDKKPVKKAEEVE